MREVTYTALAVSAKDYKENDKLVKLLTPTDGIVTAIMRGVKKPTAKLRFGALPFAFCQYTLVKRNDIFVVTGCSQIEDIFAISEDFDSFAVASLMLECAVEATGSAVNSDIFIDLLRSLKLVLYSGIDPFLICVRFVQKTIHSAGYGYTYSPPNQQINTVMDLLTHLDSFDLKGDHLPNVSVELTQRTLKKLIANFEGKFDTTLASKKLLGFISP